MNFRTTCRATDDNIAAVVNSLVFFVVVGTKFPNLCFPFRGFKKRPENQKGDQNNQGVMAN